MSPEITREFSVSDVENDHVWLKLLEGEKKGLEFAAYADSDILADLEEGERVTVEMKSRNHRNTKWEIENVEEEATSPSSSPTPVAD